MVPWHPPCALISLIFSSLRPETNCFLLCVHSLALVPASRNWPFRSNLLAVQLSRCKVRLAFASRSGFEFPQTLKTIQSSTLHDCLFLRGPRCFFRVRARAPALFAALQLFTVSPRVSSRFLTVSTSVSAPGFHPSLAP